MTLDKIPPLDLTTLDLRGLKCPMPVLKARRAIGTIRQDGGGRLTILADDPASPLDFAHFCEVGGHSLQHTTITDDTAVHYRFIIDIDGGYRGDTP